VAEASSAFHSTHWESGGTFAGKLFDGDDSSSFNIWPKSGRTHAVVARLGQPVVPTAKEQLGVTIGCNHPRFGWHTVGRFRISATSSTTGLKIQRCWDDKAPHSVSYWSIWATRLMNEGKFPDAKPWVERALNDSEPSTVFDWLVAARFYRHTGNTEQADKLYQDALQWSSSYGKGLPILEHQLKLGGPAVAKTTTDTPTK
jgi:tetratricopeptide (TPR) repeat protein